MSDQKMRFKDFLVEVLNRRAEVKKIERMDDEEYWYFDVPYGNDTKQFFVSFDKSVHTYLLRAFYHEVMKDDSFNDEMELGDIDDLASKTVDIAFKETDEFGNETIGLTGDWKNAWSVISRVLSIVMEFLSKNPQFEYIVFSADKREPSRVRAYEFMVKRLGGAVQRINDPPYYGYLVKLR
jgi:hypothetical protein